MVILIWTIQFLFVAFSSPLFVGIIRNVKAKLQGRNGAGILQPYRDLHKLFKKDELISRDASWIFTSAPFIIFAVTLVVGASIPLFTTALGSIPTSDMLIIIYTLSIGTFFLALAGMDTGSAFGGFGSSREMTMSALAEAGFIFSLLTVAIVSGSTNLFEIAGGGIVSQNDAFLPMALAFGGFFIVLLSENTRYPFDNHGTHLELTMIHEAMILEYSGKRLALMEWASANKLFIFAALGANLFFPWGIATTLESGALAIGMLALLGKVLLFCAVIAFIESSMAKYRYFRLPDLLIMAFILNVVAIGLITTL